LAHQMVHLTVAHWALLMGCYWVSPKVESLGCWKVDWSVAWTVECLADQMAHCWAHLTVGHSVGQLGAHLVVTTADCWALLKVVRLAVQKVVKSAVPRAGW
jgi:hypothetical protein